MRALAIIPSALVLSLAAGACARQDGPMRGSAAAVDSAAVQGTPAASVTSDEATVVVPAFRVPFVVGLTTVRAVSRSAGDYETLRIIESITPDGYRMVVSADASDDGPREVSIVRRVRGEDQRNARSVRIYLHTSDAEEFAGTTPGVSAAIVADLRRTGKAAVGHLLDCGVIGHPLRRDGIPGAIAGQNTRSLWGDPRYAALLERLGMPVNRENGPAASALLTRAMAR